MESLVGWKSLKKRAIIYRGGTRSHQSLSGFGRVGTRSAQKKGNRKEGIEERTCGRHVSWKRTARMMNLSRGRPRCTTLPGLLFAYRLFLQNIFHRAFVSREWRKKPTSRATSIFAGSCKHGIAASRIVGKFFSRASLLLWKLATNGKRRSSSIFELGKKRKMISNRYVLALCLKKRI